MYGILPPVVFVLLPVLLGFHKGAIGQGGSIANKNTPPGKNIEMLSWEMYVF